MSEANDNPNGAAGKFSKSGLFSRKSLILFIPVIFAIVFLLPIRSIFSILPIPSEQALSFSKLMSGPVGALAAGFLASFIFLLVIPIVLNLPVIGFNYIDELIQGADSRPSASKLQFFWWTASVLFAFTALKVRHIQIDPSAVIEIPSTVFAAMGASVLTTIGAKAIAVNQATDNKRSPNATSPDPSATPESKPSNDGRFQSSDSGDSAPVNIGSQTENGAVSGQNTSQLLRPAGDLSYTITDDTGRTDLSKVQLLSWTVLAIGFFIWKTIQSVMATDPPKSLPDIDVALVILTGIAQGTYLGGKLMVENTPWLICLIPSTSSIQSATSKISAEIEIRVIGKNFGNLQSGSLIMINEKPVFLNIKAWSDTEIKFEFPVNDETPEKIFIGVVVGGQVSANALPFLTNPPTKQTNANQPTGNSEQATGS